MVIEELLVGEEVSLLALCDGVSAQPLLPARDYKRIGDGDTGPNTGGMGAIAPVPGLTPTRRRASARSSTSRCSPSSSGAVRASAGASMPG